MKHFRTIIIALLILSVPLRVFAPERKSLPVIAVEPVNPYERLIYAIGMVETNCDTLAYNAEEQAAGFFQIRPVRLKDYNERTGNNYEMKDLYDYKISEKIFLYYAWRTRNDNFEEIARKWNGSGPKTIHYWKKVKKYLGS